MTYSRLFNKNSKRSLILAGGGMRLAYQAGVLIALDEQGITFSHIDGTSGGIFNAGMLASGLSPKEIAERWRKLDIKNFMSLRPLKKYFKPVNMMGYADADGIREKIFPNLGIDTRKVNTFEQADVTFNVCNFSDKSIEAIHHKNVQEDHLIAGVSLPIVMPGIKIGEQWYSDAVWIKDANLMEAVKRGAEELWLVWAIGNTATYLPGALNQYVHMIEMSANGGLLEEYERIHFVNGQIQDDQSVFGQSKKIKLQVIKPAYPLPLDPDLYFNKIDARSLINMGYAESKQSFENLPEQGVNLDIHATKMKDPAIRLSARFEFHGYLERGEKKLEASYFIYLVFSDQKNHQVLNAYSSIFMDAFHVEIPCYNHRLKSSRYRGKTILECRCSFLNEEELYNVTATWTLGTPIDFLLGLEFKHVEMSVAKNKNSAERLTGTLYQNIKLRLKSTYTTNIRQQDGTSGGMRLKYKMVSKFLNYAI